MKTLLAAAALVCLTAVQSRAGAVKVPFAPPCQPEPGYSWCHTKNLEGALMRLPEPAQKALADGMIGLVRAITGNFKDNAQEKRDEVVLKEAAAMAAAAEGQNGLTLLRGLSDKGMPVTVDFSQGWLHYTFQLTYSGRVGTKQPFLSDAVRERLAERYRLFCDSPQLYLTLDQAGKVLSVQGDNLGCIAD